MLVYGVVFSMRACTFIWMLSLVVCGSPGGLL